MKPAPLQEIKRRLLAALPKEKAIIEWAFGDEDKRKEREEKMRLRG